MRTRERKRRLYIEYFGNPNNPILTREQMAIQILGYKSHKGMYLLFNADELNEIEREALEIRRQKYSAGLAKVDAALIRSAEGGDTAAAKLAYQRFEGWSEKQVHSFEGKDEDINININLVKPDVRD